jgi:hypothetical protein
MFQILLAIKCHKLQACQQTRPTVQTTLDSKVSSLQQQDSDHLNAQIVIGQVRTVGKDNKPKEYPQQPETKTVAKHARSEDVYCPALLTVEVGRARRNHSTNTL